MSTGLRDGGASIRTDDGALNITWQFWDAQREAIEAINSGEYDLVIYRGGYGSGKTVTGARQTIKSALAVPRSDNLILAQDTQKGGPTTYKGFSVNSLVRIRSLTKVVILKIHHSSPIISSIAFVSKTTAARRCFDSHSRQAV